MKRITILLLLLFSAGSSPAQFAGGLAEISGVTVDRSGCDVTISFRGWTEKRNMGANTRLAMLPVITNGQYRISLPAVIVQGRNARLLESRSEWISGRVINYSDAWMTQPGESFEYRASVEFQAWMEGADLVLESVAWGCGSAHHYQPEMLSGNILPAVIREEPAPVLAVLPEPGPQSTGDTLALTFSFVIPEAQWNKAEPIYDEDRQQALIVYYRVSRSNIEPEFNGNEMILTNLIAAVNTILESSDSRVSRIIVAGFASPEGSFDFNDRLAWERAVSVKEYIMKNTGIQDRLISIYNGSEDWRGLRMLVESSDLYDKQQILTLIDTVPILAPDGRSKLRLERLKEIDGGRTYRYIQENFFPKLRNGAFIRVYYENE